MHLEKPVQTINELQKNPGIITSVAKTLVFPYIIELYDVCTLPIHRNKGYMNLLMTKLVQAFRNKTIWLAIKMDNKDFDTLVKLYHKFGFGNPKLVNKTSQEYVLDHYVLELSYPIMERKKDIYEQIKLLKQNHMMNLNVEFFEFFMKH